MTKTQQVAFDQAPQTCSITRTNLRYTYRNDQFPHPTASAYLGACRFLCRPPGPDRVQLFLEVSDRGTGRSSSGELAHAISRGACAPGSDRACLQSSGFI